ncbi:MAG: methyltransferase domain-containing protein [Ignavibacteriaceae bacterium]|nr:methyltransferase domain-containing protein [Ignavibacteriaceae bacterium]
MDNRIEQAKRSDINFIKSDMLQAELPENYFDFIYADSVIEHVLTPFNYLTKLKRLPIKQGIIYIGDPSEDSVYNSLRKITIILTGKKWQSEKLNRLILLSLLLV